MASAPVKGHARSTMNLRGKQLALGLLTIAAGLLHAYLWKGALFGDEFAKAAFYSIPIAALFVFATLFAMASLFISSSRLRVATAVLATAPSSLFMPFQSALIPIAIIALLGAWYASNQIAREYAAANYFSVRKILASGLPVFFTAVALLLATLYYAASSNTKGGALLPRSIFNTVLPLLESPLQGILPGFRADASVDQLILTVAAAQSNGEIIPAKLPPAARAELLRQGRKALGDQLGVAIVGGEKSADVLYRAANAQADKFAGPYKRYLPVLSAFGFFLAVKTFTLPVYWVTLLLVFGAVRLLKAAGALSEETKTIQVRRLVL